MTKRKKTATALRYVQDYPSIPQVTATGKGVVAEQILAKAHEHHIPVIEDPSLIELLAGLQTNDLIPADLFDAVAEVFAFIYESDQRVRAYMKQNVKQSDNKA